MLPKHSEDWNHTALVREEQERMEFATMLFAIAGLLMVLFW